MREVEEEHLRNRRAKLSRSEPCLKDPASFVYTRQSGVRIFLPSTRFVQFVFGAVHLAQIFNTIVGLDAVQVVDLLRKATMYEEEHQPVFP